MCYFCSPAQSKWYDKGRVNICSSFCNDTFQECKTTKLETMTIGEMYGNGQEFCNANSFEIIPGNDHCFDFDPSVFGDSSKRVCNVLLVLFPSVFFFAYFTFMSEYH
ncbi:hypothetical protein BSL78_04163 [Apostichopus japonicus]|uniref:Folate receptor-like domain-containing protein n=1 Tax=Stichopus japonicus TaxID=307972 RepID=A0A2G8LF16_STIJA|nr:hypothetical protein BSL78_04163 [Apostichopus japonicus]